jgi:DNA recombination protein RmuC
MTAASLLIISILIIGFSIVLFLIKKLIQESSQKNSTSPELIEWLKSMQTTIEHTNKTLNEAMRGTTSEMTRTLQSNSRVLNERLDEAARVIGALNKNVGQMSEVGRGIKSLQEFLQSPKLRGNIGEQVLKDMIGQSFPKNCFHLQYAFHSGVKVDAVLKTDGGLLCIDSKFPMENFNLLHSSETEQDRKLAKKSFVGDIQKHIDDISKKYILPDEGTLDFALMYIPSEAVYYEMVNMNDLMEYARNKRVYPVSPNTLYAHLQVLLLSFQGRDLEQKSKEIFRLLRAIQKDYQKAGDSLDILGKHVKNAYNSMSEVTGTFQTMGQKLSKTTALPQEKDDEKQLQIT